ncbi:MAG TPA: Lrp/AsnC family transcriptional regulator [Erysipelotrichaceae bacterium]|nr:Lrp/AsnC family transcriptional regulator [Erysipelotrichaceae bacterium]
MKEKILKLIENNSRLSTSDIAKLLGEQEKDVITAIGELEAGKIICGYNTIINWDKVVEEKCNALIEVKASPQRGVGFDAIASRISRYDEVDSVYLISGGFDFLVQIKGKSMKEVSSFVFDKLSTLDQIQSTATHFVLKKYKDHGVFIEEKPKNKRENIIL